MAKPLSFDVKIVKKNNKGTNSSAVKCSAYLSKEPVYREATGRTITKLTTGNVVHTGILLPDNAPKDHYDRGKLWNTIESLGSDTYAQNYKIALPQDWTKEECIKYAEEYLIDHFVKKGRAVEWAFHDDRRGEPNANPHIHALVTLRAYDKNGEFTNIQTKKNANVYELDENGNKQLYEDTTRVKGKNKLYKDVTTIHYKCHYDPDAPQDKDSKIPIMVYRDEYADLYNSLSPEQLEKLEKGSLNGREIIQKVTDRGTKGLEFGWERKNVTENYTHSKLLKSQREDFENLCNSHLPEDNKITLKSFKEMGLDLIPTIHMGGSAQLEKAGIDTLKGDLNRRIDRFNDMVKSGELTGQELKTIKKELENEISDILAGADNPKKTDKDIKKYAEIKEKLQGELRREKEKFTDDNEIVQERAARAIKYKKSNKKRKKQKSNYRGAVSNRNRTNRNYRTEGGEFARGGSGRGGGSPTEFETTGGGKPDFEEKEDFFGGRKFETDEEKREFEQYVARVRRENQERIDNIGRKIGERIGDNQSELSQGIFDSIRIFFENISERIMLNVRNYIGETTVEHGKYVKGQGETTMERSVRIPSRKLSENISEKGEMSGFSEKKKEEKTYVKKSPYVKYRFTVAENANMHDIGKYRDDFTSLDEALAYYNSIPGKNKSIGIRYSPTLQWDLTSNGNKVLDLLALYQVERVRKNPDIQSMIMMITDKFPGMKIIKPTVQEEVYTDILNMQAENVLHKKGVNQEEIAIYQKAIGFMDADDQRIYSGKARKELTDNDKAYLEDKYIKVHKKVEGKAESGYIPKPYRMNPKQLSIYEYINGRYMKQAKADPVKEEALKYMDDKDREQFRDIYVPSAEQKEYLIDKYCKEDINRTGLNDKGQLIETEETYRDIPKTMNDKQAAIYKYANRSGGHNIDETNTRQRHKGGRY